MTKTRIVGGNSTTIVGGTTRLFAKEIEINSNGRIDYYAPEYSYGEPEPRPVFEKPQIAFSGWWSPDYEGMRNLERDSLHPKAYLDETVYFQLNVSERIPVGTSITFQLWDKDVPYIPLFNDVKFDDKRVYKTAVVREINGQHRITIELYLTPKWHNDVIQDQKGSFDACLEFYWTWKYHNQNWNSSNNVLDVYASKTTLFIKPAYEGYGFPEIRSADGEIIVFSAGIVALEEPSKELEEQMKVIRDDIESKATEKVRKAMEKYSDKLRYTIAVKQLKKGYLVNNLGKIEFSHRLYTKPIFDNEGKLYEITKAANFGYKHNANLVTTKGISQLDYFKEVGVRNTVLKNAENLSYVLQILDVLKFGMEGKAEIITTMFAPLDFLNVMVYPSISKPIEEVWDGIVINDVEKAKDSGIIGIYELASSEKFNRDRYGDYKASLINSEILSKLLKGEIKTLKKLIDLFEIQLIKNNYDKSLFEYTLLYYSIKEDDNDNYKTYIDTIFINN